MALPAASALARAFSADLLLVAVVPTVMTVPDERAAAATLLPTTAAAMLAAEADHTKAYLDHLGATLEAEGTTVLAQVLRGEPVEVLVTAVARHDADLIVMATHGRAGLTTLWTGSLAARLLPQARIPLLLVKAPTAAPSS